MLSAFLITIGISALFVAFFALGKLGGIVDAFVVLGALAAIFFGVLSLVRSSTPDSPAGATPSSQPATAVRPSQSSQQTSANALPAAVPIDIGKACMWAYPNNSNGRWTGSVYSISCLSSSGSVLGGFQDGTGHSLNDWCANPAHTGGNPNLRQAQPGNDSPGSWECVPIGQ
jgi:hypothetical protein